MLLTAEQEEILRLFLDHYYVATEPREGDTNVADYSRMLRDYRIGNDVVELATQMGWGDESVEYLDVLYKAINRVFTVATVRVRLYEEEYYYVQPRWGKGERVGAKEFSMTRQARVLVFVRARKLQSLLD